MGQRVAKYTFGGISNTVAVKHKVLEGFRALSPMSGRGARTLAALERNQGLIMARFVLFGLTK